MREGNGVVRNNSPYQGHSSPLQDDQWSTQPYIADTWVVTRSSFTERFADSCVFSAHYRYLCFCNAEF